MSVDQVLDAKQKALLINLDNTIYGSFAEIGAGQEVVRHFFRAGGAAGTIAKTMSAYDMKFSDDIYGKESSGRYVSESRVLKMLSHEFSLLEKRLVERSETTRFFAFADTVAAKSFRGTGENHGWIGIRFQHAPKAKVSEVIIHTKMLDKENVQQQEVLGFIGVNLVHACYFYADNREKFVSSLMDNISKDRLEIDMISVSGPAFHNQDSRLFSLELVKRDFSKAVMFDPKGNVLQASDSLYKKNVVLCRGSYRPPTLLNLDMLESGTKAFKKDLKDSTIKDVLILPEISMSKLAERDGKLDNEDFLARIELLNALGHFVLVSNYEHYSELSDFVSHYNRGRIGFVLGYYNLHEIFNEADACVDGENLMTSVGTLLGCRTKLYIYPAKNEEDGSFLTFDHVEVSDVTKLLIEYLNSSGLIENLKEINTKVFDIWSRKVLKMIVEGTTGWEDKVPKVVEKEVKTKCLFGAKCE